MGPTKFPPELLSQLHVVTPSLDSAQFEELGKCEPTTHTDAELIKHFQRLLCTSEQTLSSILASDSSLDGKVQQKPFRHKDCCLSLSPLLFSVLTSSILPYVDDTLRSTASLGDSPPAAPGPVLSVGSGTGLLERGLQLSALAYKPSQSSPLDSSALDPEFDTELSSTTTARPSFIPALSVHGIEVHTSVNKYLPDSSMTVVKGTWEISPQVDRARVLMFVYPRRVDLMGRYLQRFGIASRRESRRGFEMDETRLGMVVWLGPLVDWEEGGFGLEVRRWAGEVGAMIEEKRGAEMGLMAEEIGVFARLDEAVNNATK